MMWEKVKLGDIASFSNGINFNKTAYEKGVKLIGVSNFGDRFYPDYLQLQEVKKDIVRPEDCLRNGDIVFVRSNGNKELVGRCMLVKNPTERVTYSGFCIQPSEFMKPVFVLICATSIREQHEKKKILFFYVSKEMMILTGAFIVIVGLQWWCRDLGSLPTFAAAYGCALACRLCYPKAKFSKKTIIGISAIAAILVALALRFAPGYVQNRLSVDIWNQMEGDGYQQCKALIAIAEGGLFGKGPGCGSLYKVFASDTDIVFSTICEEWGFLVALLSILILMAMMLLPMINKPRSYFHTTMILGCVAVLIVQMGLNIFGSCNLIPFTGVTIPFISQGGSSMITSGFLAGMLKAGQSPVFKKPEPKKKKAKARKAVAAA